ASGNAALVVVQTVTVTDAESPVIAAVSPIAVSSDLDVCEATPAIIAPVVSDNQGAIAAIGTRDDGFELSDPYPLGVTMITWTAVDGSGNAATPVEQTVTVTDNQAPVIAAVSNITQSTDLGLSTATVVIGVPWVTDNCDNLLTAIGARSDALPLTDPYPLGATTITWTAVDASGNFADEVVQTVTVTDAEVPVIAAVLPIALSSDQDACEATPAIIAP